MHSQEPTQSWLLWTTGSASNPGQHCFIYWHKLDTWAVLRPGRTLAELFLRDVIVWKVFTCCTLCSPAASVWMYSAACACSVSIIRQLYHSKGRDIIVCFLFHWAQSSVNCESIHCCLGYMFLLVFSASKNNAEKSELRGSPRWYESTVGTQCKASSRKQWMTECKKKKNDKKLNVVI